MVPSPIAAAPVRKPRAKIAATRDDPADDNLGQRAG
jgi:hypothetical protein